MVYFPSNSTQQSSNMKRYLSPLERVKLKWTKKLQRKMSEHIIRKKCRINRAHTVILKDHKQNNREFTKVVAPFLLLIGLMLMMYALNKI